MRKKKTGSMVVPSADKLLGVTSYQPQAQQVLPEPSVQGAVKVRLDPKTTTTLKPPTGKGQTMKKKIEELRQLYPNLEVLGPA